MWARIPSAVTWTPWLEPDDCLIALPVVLGAFAVAVRHHRQGVARDAAADPDDDVDDLDHATTLPEGQRST